MDPSSLIFFVIFAVWAAYMLKHWVRRRENLATARTVDRFSEAMRMLERRTPVKADVSTRDDAPQRIILRPQVSVKGATSVDAAESSQRVGAATSGAAATTGAGASKRSAAAFGARVPERIGAANLSRVQGASAALASPKVKRGALLGSVGFFLVTAVLAPFTSVPFWMPLLGLVAVVGVVAWLRRSAVAARQARSTKPVVRREASVRRESATDSAAHVDGADDAQGVAERAASRDERSAARRSTPARATTSRAAASVSAQAAGATRVEPVSDQGAGSVTLTKRSPLIAETDVASLAAESDVVFDQEPRDDAAARAAAELFDNAAWEPVDVPRPTYTLKAKADRDEVAPAATVDETDTRPLAARYENTPVEDLPFDGMALDEDYGELPQVYRAG